MKIENEQKGQESNITNTTTTTTTYSLSKSKEFKENHLFSTEKRSSGISLCLLKDFNKVPYLYQIWPGKNIFLLNGRLMFGPNAKIFLGVVFIFVAMSLPFFIVIFPESCKENLKLISITAVIFFFYSCLNFLLTVFADSGVIPRRIIMNCLDNSEIFFKLFEIIEKKEEKNALLNAQNLKTYLKNGKMIVIRDKNMQYFFNFCEICQIYKPPLSRHCK